MHLDPIPFITLPNWVKAAARCGFNIEPVFREVGIETDLIHLESATVSAPLLREVMEACIARTRDPDQHFPFVLGETFAFDYLPDIETFLATSPTLRGGLRVFDWVRELINPMIHVELVEQGEEAQLIVRLDGGAEPDPRPYFSETTMATIMKFGRLMLGGTANFKHLGFRHRQPANVEAYARYFAVPLRFEQPAHSLVFDRALLDRPLEGAFPALHKQAEFRVEQRLAKLPAKPGLVAAIEQAFEAQPALLGQGIERMATALGLHPRTLQRRLQDSEQRYAEIQDRARLRLASRWLQDGQLDIETISERLGFSDRRSFTRAFTRWSGVSPSSFRSKARSEAASES